MEESVVEEELGYDLRNSVWLDRSESLNPIISRLSDNGDKFSPDEVKVLRYGTNLVLQAGGFVLRVSDYSQLSQINDNLETVNALGTMGAPVVKPMEAEAIVLDDKAVLTRWLRKQPLQEDVGISYAKLGSALKDLHLTKIKHPLDSEKLLSSTNKYNVVGRFESRLSALPDDVPVEVKSSLYRLSEYATSLYESISTDDSAQHIVHGDASVNNAVFNGKHENLHGTTSALLIDLDGVCAGHREIDLGAVKMATKRYGDPRNYETLLSAYNDNSVNHDLIDLYAQIKEITAITWISTLWARNERAQSELMRRIWCFENDACSTEKWERF